LPVDAIDQHHHVCALLASDAEREELLVEFARPGLERGERVWCVTEDVRDTQDALARGGIGVGEALAAGRLRVLAAHDAYLAASPFRPPDMIATLHDAVDDALAAGCTGFRVAGDMSWAAGGASGADRLEEYEAEVDEVFLARPAAALCQYDRRRFDGERIDALRALHRDVARVPVVSGDGALRVHRLHGSDGVWLRLAGEADVSSAAALAAALDDLPGTPEDVHVDMLRLRFMDVSGLRPLGALAARRPVTLHHPPAEVRRLAELLGRRLPPLTIAP
jgi:hypothetical protein